MNIVQNSKHCSKCNCEKDSSKFYMNPKTGYVRPFCKDCEASYKKMNSALARKDLKNWYVKKLVIASGWPKEAVDQYPNLVELHRQIIKTRRMLNGKPSNFRYPTATNTQLP